MKISLCMIVNNDEKYIMNCLNTALKIVDEAIVVDIGSTDDTKKIILEKYGYDDRVKFIEYIWENDYGKARNESLKHAKGDWILVLNADERILADNAAFRKILSDSNDKSGFVIPEYDVSNEGDAILSPAVIRLFKNKNPRYEGAVNEQVFLDEGIVLGYLENIKIYRFNYDELDSTSLDFYEKELLAKLENSIYQENTNVQLHNNEFEENKNLVKKDIEKYILNNMFENAEELIKEYEKYVKGDIDIYSFKGIIAIMQGNMNAAEEVLNEGMLKDSNNADLLYNIAKLYKDMGEKDKSIYFYKKLYHITQNNEDKESIREEIHSMGGSTINRVLIGSPICQKPKILKEFLQSLTELNKDDLEVDYFFIDNNDIDESSFILSEFSSKENNVIIKKLESDNEYVYNNENYKWKEKSIWKTAGFKDEIIEYAKINSYDHLFFIDSNLVLYPYTLKHLISTGKDIISEIFWTKWLSNSPEMPQVWLYDQYIQYEFSRNEKLNDLEISNRHVEFLNKLRVPGVYEVGGLGSCTLISKYAIDKGISFSEIKNISFLGEDRHFCVRASALGLSLYVDTHYPAYHIYRDSDLDGVRFYKNPDLKLKEKITLITNDNSGCNTSALYKQIPDYILDEFEVELVSGSNREKIENSKICVATHYNSQYGAGKINIDLWHGFPLKTMGVMNKQENIGSSKFLDMISNNIDFCISYSNLYTFLMSSCSSLRADKYKVTGIPRNDLLINGNSKKNLERLINKNLKNKTVIFYVPTFRTRYAADGSIIADGLNFDEILSNFKNLDKFFANNNLHLVAKKHSFNSERWNINESKNVTFLTNEMLYNTGIDFYEILGASDMLITDYSSVYFDYLLLDRPIIFFSKDLEEYRTNRGLLLEPYEFWTPGPKVSSNEELIESISKFISDKNYYSDERETIRNIAHCYKDFNSRERVWREIYNYIKTL